MTNIVITAAKRTAVGSFLGSFAGTPAHELGPRRIRVHAISPGPIRTRAASGIATCGSQ